MNIRLLPFLLIILCFGCKKEDTLTFETISISNTSCKTCPSITIEIPKSLENTRISETINTAIREEIIALLNFNEENSAQDIESAMEAFETEYKDLKEKFSGESVPWEAKVLGLITFENQHILTIKLNAYIYTGGAHGYETIRFLNFDKVTATELENEELFTDFQDFLDFTERQFREQEGIPAETDINSTGFMFDSELFYLPTNIGYTEAGIQLFYEPYEIAAYADGASILILPYTKVNPYLRQPVSP